MSEDGYFRYSSVDSPLTAALTNSLLQDADPVLYKIIEFYKGVIELHCGDRWDAAVAASNRNDLVGKIVSQVIPYDPLPFARNNQFRFPLMAAYRSHEEYRDKTNGWINIESDIDLLYILPPLGSDQTEGLHPFLTHINRVIVDRSRNGFDTNYNSGEQPWVESGIEQISMESCDYGKIPGFSTDLYFPAISLKIKCVERSMYASNNYEVLDRVDVQIDSVNDVDEDLTVVELEIST